MIKLILFIIFIILVLLFVVYFDMKNDIVHEIEEHDKNVNQSGFVKCNCPSMTEKVKCGFECYDQIKNTNTNDTKSK